MRINKLTAIVLAGAISCTAPAMVYADDTSAAVDQAVEMLQESGVDELLSDPDKVVDIIVAAKEAVGQTDVSDDTISSAIDVAASSLGVTLSASDKSTLVSLITNSKIWIWMRISFVPRLIRSMTNWKVLVSPKKM